MSRDPSNNENEPTPPKEPTKPDEKVSFLDGLGRIWGWFVFFSAILGLIVAVVALNPRFQGRQLPNGDQGALDLSTKLREITPEMDEVERSSIRWARLMDAQLFYAHMLTDLRNLKNAIAKAIDLGQMRPGAAGPFGPHRSEKDLPEAEAKWRLLQGAMPFYEHQHVVNWSTRFLILRDAGSSRTPQDEKEFRQLIEMSKKPLGELLPDSTWCHYLWLQWVYEVVTGNPWPQQKFYH